MSRNRIIKDLEEKLLEIFDNAIVYILTNQSSNTTLEQYIEEEYQKLVDYIEEALKGSYHAQLNIDGIITRFLKAILPKHAAKRAIIRYLLSKEKLQLIDLELVRAFCLAFGFVPSIVMRDSQLLRSFAEILPQFYRVKGIKTTIELIVRMFLGVTNVTIFDVYAIKHPSLQFIIQLQTVNLTDNTVFTFTTQTPLSTLQQTTNSWWTDIHDTVPTSELIYNKYRLPYIAISLQDFSLSIRQQIVRANELLMKILLDPRAQTTNDTIPSLNITLSISQHVVLYILVTQLIYEKLYASYGINEPDYPARDLLWYFEWDLTEYPRDIAIQYTTLLLRTLTKLSSSVSLNVAEVFVDHFNNVRAQPDPNSLENYIISNYPGVVTVDVVNEINANKDKLFTIIQNIHLFINAFGYQMGTQTAAQAYPSYYPYWHLLKKSGLTTWFNEIDNIIHSSGVTFSEILYALNYLYDNGLLNIYDFMSILFEIEANILNFAMQGLQPNILYLYPLVQLFGFSEDFRRALEAILEYIKPIHVKLLLEDIYILLNYNDRDNVSLWEAITFTSNVTFGLSNIVCNVNCTEIRNLQNNFGEFDVPTYETAPTTLNYRTNYTNSEVTGYLQHFFSSPPTVTVNGYILDTGQRFDDFTDDDPANYAGVLSSSTNSVYCGNVPHDLIQILVLDNTNELAIHLAQNRAR